MNFYIFTVILIHSAIKATPISQTVYGSGNDNVEEIGGNFEGDIILTPEQSHHISGYDRSGLIDLKYRWPDNTVYYSLNSVFDADQRAYIEQALTLIEEVTCVKFVQRTNEVNYVQVNGNNSGCSSNVGYLARGAQNMNLEPFPPGEGCFRVGTIIHEFLHTLGFYHMQSAFERDYYVTVIWENITPGAENNFNIYGPDRITNFGIPYDVESVMHYSAYAFSKNGLPTIIPHDLELKDDMGQRLGLTIMDIDRVNTMYECNSYKRNF